MHNKRHLSIVGTATLGPKGQVVIPAETRQRLGIKPGDKLIALEIDDRKAISFITEDEAQEMVDHLAQKAGLIEDLKSTINNKSNQEQDV